MFGKRDGFKPQQSTPIDPPLAPTQLAVVPRQAEPVAAAAEEKRKPAPERLAVYYSLKKEIFGALLEAIDVTQLSMMEPQEARQEIRGIAGDILAAKKAVISAAAQDEMVEEICNDVLGYGPLEPLLARDDIADIMVNGSDPIYIEAGGRMIQTDIQFRDTAGAPIHIGM